MCQECRQSPCHPRCPNAVTNTICMCDVCGDEIYEGEPVYVILGKNICERCIEDARTYADFEDM